MKLNPDQKMNNLNFEEQQNISATSFSRSAFAFKRFIGSLLNNKAISTISLDILFLLPAKMQRNSTTSYDFLISPPPN